jgi:hypothetical protein
LNKVQQAAFDLIREDARFLYAITHIMQNATNISSNYVCMSIPYIGIFADGSEQWCKKVGLSFPTFNQEEKAFYAQIRQGHKLFDKNYAEYKQLLLSKLAESDNYFYSIRSLREKIFGYYNVGTDVCDNEFCGNTILCSMYIPIKTLGNDKAGPWLRDMSYIAGSLAAHFGCTELPVYKYNDSLVVEFKDYHFFKSSPLKMNTDLAFILFSVLCSINYVIEFIENYFVEEIPQKLKYAYLQYYYLCDFVKDLNQSNDTNYYLSEHLYNRNFRNCFAHYGLGQYINEDEIVEDDILKGLTYKAFNKDYVTTKDELYSALNNLAEQIKHTIF